MRAAIRPVVATLISAGAVLAAIPAQANVGDTSCADDALTCSKGTTTLHADSRDTIGTTADSGWWPKCNPPTPDGHCGKLVQASISIDLAAYPSSVDPLWTVDMGRGAVVDARWPTDQAFELTVPTAATKEGTFKITHTIIPNIHLYFEVLGFKLPVNYDATALMQKLATQWNYKAANSVNFLPWAIEPPVINLVPAPASSSTPLFETTIVDNDDWQIDLGLTAKTSPEFSYRTTKVTLGTGAPIVATDGSASLPMVDADYLDVPAVVEGEIKVKGDFDATPYGVITYKPWATSFDFDIGLIPGIPYTEKTPVAVKFPATTVHIPLPNVKAPKTVIDLGQVQIGSPAEKSVAIANTGELGASLSFKSDNPQFSMIDTVVAAPKTDYPLVIRFAPTGEGPQKATITVKSNDPDSPTQTFEVQAYGTLAPSDDGDSKGGTGGSGDLGDEEFEPGADTGCGCRTAPTHSSYGALGGLGLAALFFVRRRRQRAA